MGRETKDQRFKRVAEKRVQNVLDALKSLSGCANPRVYEWTDEQLRTIWQAIENEAALCRAAFEDPGSRNFRL